jgi:ribonuclease HI
MITIYADGACSPNPGICGIGFVILDSDNPNVIITGNKCLGLGTNNIAELTAIKLALSSVNNVKIKLYTDSSYSIGILSKNWKPKLNIDLINDIKEILSKMDVEFFHVKGHNGDKYNEMVDKLAVNARLKLKESELELVNVTR